MTMQRWLIAAAVACGVLSGCTGAPEEGTTETTPRPQQAGQPVNPWSTAGHLAAMDVAALAGDQRAMQAHAVAAQKDMLRSMRLPDPARPIDHEAARAAVRPLPGVRSSVWIDRSNLLVMVAGSRYRSVDTLDRICLALEPLGDTLGVVVNLQDVTATTSEGADTLSRNCQLTGDERALGQPKRQVDVLDPELRRVFRAQQGTK
jgi:outer membrane murein-binding lipoprotein Lpp